MPRLPKIISRPQEHVQDAFIKSLVSSIPENAQYLLVDYCWFYDYYKSLKLVGNTAAMSYSPTPKNRDIVEFTSIVNEIAAIVKIPIIKTNITEEKSLTVELDIPFSKYNNKVLIFVLEEKFVTMKYNYDIALPVLEFDNRNFFTINAIAPEQVEETEEDNSIDSDEEIEDKDLDNEKLSNEDEEQNSILLEICKNPLSNKIKFTSFTEEKFPLKQNCLYTRINENTLKNVVCYLSMEFENFKNHIKKLGNASICVSILNNVMTLNAINGNNNKNCIISVNVIPLMKKYTQSNKKISFFINSKHLISLKSLPTNFAITPDADKKIFKTIEIKIVVDETTNPPIFGLTISPSNLNNDNRMIGKFDIYNSIIFYISQRRDEVS